MSGFEVSIVRFMHLLAWLVCVPLYAADERIDAHANKFSSYEIGEEWKETLASLPGVLTDETFIEIDEDLLNGTTRVHIAAASINIGADGVVRFVVQLSTPAGSRNTLFEGIRCETLEYRTIAYAGANKQFRELARSRWKKVTAGGRPYHRALAEFFLCADEGWPQPLENIHQLLNDQTKAVVWNKNSAESWLP